MLTYVRYHMQEEEIQETPEAEDEDEDEDEDEGEEEVHVGKGKAKVLPGPEGWVPEEGTYEEDEDDEDEDDEDEDEDEDEEQAIVPFEPVLTLAAFPTVEGETEAARAARLDEFEETVAEEIGADSEDEDLEQSESVMNYEGDEFDALGFVDEADDVPYAPEVEQLLLGYQQR